MRGWIFLIAAAGLAVLGAAAAQPWTGMPMEGGTMPMDPASMPMDPAQMPMDPASMPHDPGACPSHDEGGMPMSGDMPMHSGMGGTMGMMSR